MGNWTDCGELGPEVLLFGGPYANLHATRALLDVARARGFDPSRVICTGDVAGYCAHPAETVAEIRRFGGPVVAGNCERQLASGDDNCGCGYAPGGTCDRLSDGWYRHATAELGDDARSWMASLPDGLVFSLDGRRYAVIHGGATGISRFLWPSTARIEFEEEIRTIRTAVGAVDGIIAGHCGVAFHRRPGGIDWINAGAIGLPPHDGRCETRFTVLRSTGPVFERLHYDAKSARQAMRAVGLTQGYDEALRSGWWPSEETMPQALHR